MHLILFAVRGRFSELHAGVGSNVIRERSLIFFIMSKLIQGVAAD